MNQIQLQKIVNDVNIEIDFLDFQIHQQIQLVKRLRARRLMLKRKKKFYGNKLEEIKNRDIDFITSSFHDDDLPF